MRYTVVLEQEADGGYVVSVAALPGCVGEATVAGLPACLSGRQARADLEPVGFVFQCQTGSHMILCRDAPRACVVVPDHKAVRQGTLQHFIADAGLTVDQFTAFLAR